jgi:hypothetical protein
VHPDFNFNVDDGPALQFHFQVTPQRSCGVANPRGEGARLTATAIIDGMCLKALPRQSGEYLLDVVMRRY